MHLKSITLKGFKSFPDRTRLEFGSGVSVIVGPNGSGKSNITDAVLWALGEQSPLSVRGQTMQDVIFAGGEGVRSRSSCEVEVILDNSDGRLRSDFSEISIERRLDRSGEGTYRLNGARCRLVDVIDVLSDTGLGKEMHSVISQGRVEAIIHSKPPDRTALIEEAAGLTKHRKRRRRAELKLARTQDNLDRALDVEREARTHLRPLKRQAEAAEMHSRLERQSLELRALLGTDALLAVREELSGAERAAGDARRRRDAIANEQDDVSRRREETERRLADHAKERERLASRLFATRSALERLGFRLETVNGHAEVLEARIERARATPEAAGSAPSGESSRLRELESELAELERQRDARLASELEAIGRERRDAERRASVLGDQIRQMAQTLEQADRSLEAARERRSAARERAEAAASRRAVLEVELGAIVERQRLLAAGDGESLGQKLSVESGFESAVAAVLGGRLGALVVSDLREGARAIERADGEGARALVKRRRFERRDSQAPAAGAVPLLDHVRPDPEVRELVERLLSDAWVVERIDDVQADFDGVAVTRAGVAYHGMAAEIRRAPASGAGRALAERSRAGEIRGELELVIRDFEQSQADALRAAEDVQDGEHERDRSEIQLRDLRREHEEALEAARRAAWLLEQRREFGGGPGDARRAELVAEIGAERRVAEGRAREQAQSAARRRRLEIGVEHARRVLAAARRLAASLEGSLAVIEERCGELDQELLADEAVGERAAAELRRLAQSEYDLQARLREASEELTAEEVHAAQIRDREEALVLELEQLTARLGQDATDGGRLSEEERQDAESRLERLERRRERIGPVNPLAESEYQDALEHVEDLERQRQDLEAALGELERLIRDTDRLIRESFDRTFEVAARNFEDVIQHLFPGGQGRLRLVKAPRPRAVFGGADEGASEDTTPPESEPDINSPTPPESDSSELDSPGIEIEVTPAGKATKRLSLLSGGEKSLVALAFLFAVFLARPCPFYILDEVEAALDDVNIDRFLALVRGYAGRSQFIVITHQRRTMEAADVLYGVSMGRDGVSKVVSRRLEQEQDSDDGEERLSAVA